jgi:hypothetical protein
METMTMTRDVRNLPEPDSPRIDHHHKVPLWIGTDRKVLNGVKKCTTVAEVIRSLIHAPDDPCKFVIVEKWRKVSEDPPSLHF